MFPINTFLNFLPGVSIDSEGERTSAAPSMKSVFIFHLFVSYLLLRHVIYVSLLFSSLYLQLFCGRQTLKEIPVCALMSKQHLHILSTCYVSGVADRQVHIYPH